MKGVEREVREGKRRMSVFQREGAREETGADETMEKFEKNVDVRGLTRTRWR